jgi:uncharacterized protein
MIYVLFHGGGCPDGFGAAWAAHQKLGDDGVRYLPVMYHEPVPAMEPGSDIYLVDFCYPPDVLREIADHASNVTVIDHHKTARDAIQRTAIDDGFDAGGPETSSEYHYIRNNVSADFDLDHSGAVLTWRHFHPGEPVPRLLQFVEDRDLWRWELPYSRAVSAYLASMPQDFASWDDIATAFFAIRSESTGLDSAATAWRAGHHPFQREGAAILRAQAQTIEQAVRRHRWAVLGGHRVPIVNATIHGSETGEALCRAHPDAPFAAYYFDTVDGRRGWGLRSRGGHDVSEVAKLYGGGGHAAASGFTTGLDFYGDAR